MITKRGRESKVGCEGSYRFATIGRISTPTVPNISPTLPPCPLRVAVFSAPTSSAGESNVASHDLPETIKTPNFFL